MSGVLKIRLVLICFSVLILSCTTPQKRLSLESVYPIIPTPQKITYGTNEVNFKSVSIIANDFTNEGALLENFFNDKNIEISKEGLQIQILKGAISESTSDETYQLSINETIKIVAPTAKGAFYGIQTLKQLFRSQKDGGVFPKIEIIDWPAFKIRGLMHDTGRNYQTLGLLKEQLDVLANYKMNVFHWHLTDNPGWRLESEKYPELQSEEATSRKKGKFYSQEDFKEILVFCEARHITVIPEFDIPGHSQAFRKALNIESMNTLKVQQILIDLIDELCALAPAEKMPYIHLGTDEVRHKEEKVDDDFLVPLFERIRSHGREVIGWSPGIEVPKDETSISQLWARASPRKNHSFIDSRSNYINHLDPFAGMARMYFQQPCRQESGDEIALGGILCAWPDNRIDEERNLLKQNPIYPAIVFYSDAIWKGRAKDYPEYWAKLPMKETSEFEEFKLFEDKVITHRNQFFNGKEFPYIAQTNVQWKLIGPFNHDGDLLKSFPVEEYIQENYTIDGQDFSWTGPHIGATIHLKHFFGFESITDKKRGTYYAYSEIYSPDNREQDFWIGFQNWSRSGGRRGGPTPKLGQWHTSNPKIWINDNDISAPEWKQPNLEKQTLEIPFVDEDYYYREPTKVSLKKGWNKVLLKIPHGGTSWKWMFTCVPINSDENGFKEARELKFSTTFNNK